MILLGQIIINRIQFLADILSNLCQSFIVVPTTVFTSAMTVT